MVFLPPIDTGLFNLAGLATYVSMEKIWDMGSLLDFIYNLIEMAEKKHEEKRAV